jgi:P-type Cu2+ transporter
MTGSTSITVLEVSGVHWVGSKNVAEAVLSRRPRVLWVDANATLSHPDPARD